MGRRRTRTRRSMAVTAVAAVALAAAGLVPAAHAVPGDLEPSFGDCGFVLPLVTQHASLSGTTNDLIAPDDGTAIITGSIARSTGPDLFVARLSADGQLDDTFGEGGVFEMPDGEGNVLALHPATNSTRILVGGWTNETDGVIAALDLDGNIDDTFGTDGYVTLAGVGEVLDLSVDSTGRIYAVAANSVLYRRTSTGAADSTFNGTGQVTVPFAVQQVVATSGGPVVAGNGVGDPPQGWKLDRYTVLGVKDPTFNSNATVTTTFDPPASHAFDHADVSALVEVGTDLLVGGTATFTSTGSGPDVTDMAMARYTSSGAAVSGFGTSGKLTQDFAPNERLLDLTVDGSTVYVAGELSPAAGGRDGLLAAFTTNGALSPGFGTFGSVTDDIGYDQTFDGVRVLEDGSIAVGHSLSVEFEGSVISAQGAIAHQPDDARPSAFVLDGIGTLNPTSIGDGRAPACALEQPQFPFVIARDSVLRPEHRNGYVLDGFGGLHAFRSGLIEPLAPPATGPYFGFDIARAIELRDDEGGYLLDGYGGLHRVAVQGGTAPASAQGPYFGFDIARDIVFLPGGTGGYLLDGYGGIHPFSVGINPKPPAVANGPYFGFDIARQIVLNAAGTGGYLLDGFGAAHAFSVGSNPKPPAVTSGPYFGWDIARDFVLAPSGESGGYVLDGYGGIHPVRLGDPDEGPDPMHGAYFGEDIARSLLVFPAPPPPE